MRLLERLRFIVTSQGLRRPRCLQLFSLRLCAAVQHCTVFSRSCAYTTLATKGGHTIPYAPPQRAAEFHEQAAHAHRAAAVHHGKQDHLTGHEHSRQALEHADKAFQVSQEAYRKSVKSTEQS